MSASVSPTAFSRLRCGARSTPLLIRSDLMPAVRLPSRAPMTPPKTKTPEVSLGGPCDPGLGWPLDHRAPAAQDEDDGDEKAEQAQERHAALRLAGCARAEDGRRAHDVRGQY